MVKKILCLSGGLDSLIAYYWLNEPATIFFDTGGYADAEKEIVLKIAPNTIIDKSLNFEDISVDKNAFIPNRNLLFAARASQYANEVVIAGVKDDLVGDKNPKAFEAMTEVLRTLNNNNEYNVISPFWGFSKVEVVEWFLKNVDNAKELIELSLSCYSPIDGQECMSCPSCFRKWNALWENGIKKDFKNVKLMEEYLQKAKADHYIPARNKSILKCVEDYFYEQEAHLIKSQVSMLRTYCFDIDGVLTIETEGHDYPNRTPNREMIKQVNGLHSAGHKIILNTARWGTDWTVTKTWLHKYNVQYDQLLLGKPKADFYIDDKMLDIKELLNNE